MVLSGVSCLLSLPRQLPSQVSLTLLHSLSILCLPVPCFGCQSLPKSPSSPPSHHHPNSLFPTVFPFNTQHRQRILLITLLLNFTSILLTLLIIPSFPHWNGNSPWVGLLLPAVSLPPSQCLTRSECSNN